MSAFYDCSEWQGDPDSSQNTDRAQIKAGGSASHMVNNKIDSNHDNLLNGG